MSSMLTEKRGGKRKAPSARKRSDLKRLVKFDISRRLLDNLIKYFFTENDMVNRVHILGFNRLIHAWDPSCYDDKVELKIRVEMIKLLAVGYLDKGLREMELLDCFLEGKWVDDMKEVISEILDEQEEDDGECTYDTTMSNEKIMELQQFMSTRLMYSYLFDHAEQMGAISDSIKRGKFDSLEDINKEAMEMMSGMYRDMINAKSIAEEEEADFMLDADSLEESYAQTIEELNRPSNVIRTGCKDLNRMINGGFEGGRVYLYIAPTGGFKSGFLLNTLKWYRKYNPGITTKDPTKIPCALYLSMENSQRDTKKRWYASMVPIDEQKPLKEVSMREVMDKLHEHDSVANEDNPNQILFRYRPNRSCTTSDLDAMIDDLAFTHGLEVVFVVMDYIKRIRSAEHIEDFRIELGEIANEFCTIAKRRNVPLVTATQVNRDTLRRLKEAKDQNQANLAKSFSLSDIGESGLMAENVDCVIAGYLEATSNGDRYLGFSRLKLRDQDYTPGEEDLTYFAQPFEQMAGMRLVEDIHDPTSAAIYDLSDGLRDDDNRPVNTAQSGNSQRRKFQRSSTAAASVNMLDEDDGLPEAV